MEFSSPTNLKFINSRHTVSGKEEAYNIVSPHRLGNSKK